MAGHVIPNVAGAWLVHVRFIFIERDFIGYTALKIVTALIAAVIDLPSLLIVVAGNRGHRPIMSIARDFAAIVEIVEQAELKRQLVLVRSYIGAVHRKRWIAVACFQIAEYLIVGAILFDDVDNVMNRV